MKAEEIRELLRPFAGDIVDKEILNDHQMSKKKFQEGTSKYELLVNSILMTRDYPLMLLYLEDLLKKFTPEELNINEDLHSKDCGILLRIRGFRYNSKVLKMLINSGLNINLHYESGLTILADTIITREFFFNNYARCDNIKMYVENGADVNFKFVVNHELYTPLSFCLNKRYSYEPNINIIKILLDYGATCDLDQIKNCKYDDKFKNELIQYIETNSGKYTKPAKRTNNNK